MNLISHPQGRCPTPNKRYRRVGDPRRDVYWLCGACKAAYSAPPFSFEFVSADEPEWQRRRAERRLPARVTYP